MHHVECLSEASFVKLDTDSTLIHLQERLYVFCAFHDVLFRKTNNILFFCTLNLHIWSITDVGCIQIVP